MGEVEKLLIMMAFDWFKEESKHTKEVDTEIAAELFLNSTPVKSVVKQLKRKSAPQKFRLLLSKN